MRDLYTNPELVYSKNKLHQGRVIPILRYLSKPVSHPESMVYQWIVKTGSQFNIYTASIMNTTTDLEGFSLANFCGTQVKVSGDFKQLKEILDTSAMEVEPLLAFNADKVNATKPKMPHPHYQDNALDQKCTDFVSMLSTHFGLAMVAIFRRDEKALEKLFKGLTVGISKTEYGFLMKGLKSAYEKMNIGANKRTYSGLRMTNFGIKDLVDYIRTHRNADSLLLGAKDYETVFYAQIPGFKKVKWDDPNLPGITKSLLSIPNIPQNFKGIPDTYLMEVAKSMKHWVDAGQQKNTKMPFKNSFDQTGVKDDTDDELRHTDVIKPAMQPSIVHEYGFRSDTRSPLAIYGAGGFHANATRYYDKEDKLKAFEEKRDRLLSRAATTYGGHDSPQFDAYLHQHAYDAISVFVSVSRNPREAAKFVALFGGGTGYLYLMRCVGAIDQEASFNLLQYPNEKEISVVGTLDWDDIIAVRPIIDKKLPNYCYVNMNNPWMKNEMAVQWQAIGRLLLFGTDAF